MKSESSSHRDLRRACQVATMFVLLVAAGLTISFPAAASRHYTEKHLEVLAGRVGTTFWVQESDSRTPNFLSGPSPTANPVRSRAGDSFQIMELIGRKNKNPYYKVRFDSGKEAYLRPETLLEELNLTILTVDPLADEKRRAAENAEEERKRVEWINAQPWPVAAKEAALKGQAVPGMNRSEVKRIVGPPGRVTNVQPRGAKPEEHWFYPDGRELIFHQGLLIRTTLSDAKKP